MRPAQHALLALAAALVLPAYSWAASENCTAPQGTQPFEFTDGVNVLEAFRRGGNRDATIKVFANADHELMRVDASPTPVEGYLPLMRKWLEAHTSR